MKSFMKQFTGGVAASTLVLSLLAPVGTALAAPTEKIPGSVPDKALGYEAAWESQTQPSSAGYDYTVVGEDEYYKVDAGDEVTVDASFRNTGDNTWVNTGADEQVCISIYKDPAVKTAPSGSGYDTPTNPLFGTSYFQGDGWQKESTKAPGKYYRVGCLNESEVAPGEVGTFTLNFQIPDDAVPGMYREDISLSSGPYWIKNETNGDPFGVAHIWVGFDVVDPCVENPNDPMCDVDGEEVKIDIDCFKNSIERDEENTCIITVMDKFGNPVVGYDDKMLYAEFVKGAGEFYNAGYTDNITDPNSAVITEFSDASGFAEEGLAATYTYLSDNAGALTLGDTVVPGVYALTFRAPSEGGELQLRVTSRQVIPSVSKTVSIQVASSDEDKSLQAAVFPEILTSGVDYNIGSTDIYSEEGLIFVSVVDDEGDPIDASADLRVEVVGPVTVHTFDPVMGVGSQSSKPFAYLGNGVHVAKVRAGSYSGTATVRVFDNDGNEAQVEVETRLPNYAINIFPKTIYSNSNNADEPGVATIVIGMQDAYGAPLFTLPDGTYAASTGADSHSKDIEVSMVDNPGAGALDCEFDGTTTRTSGHPAPYDLTDGVVIADGAAITAGNKYVYVCQYHAGSVVSGEKTARVRIKNTITDEEIIETINVHHGNVDDNIYATSVDPFVMPELLNAGDDNAVLFMNLQDSNGNAVGGDRLNIDIDSDAFTGNPTEIVLDTVPTGIYYSIPSAGGFAKEAASGADIDVDYTSPDPYGVDFDQTIEVPVLPYELEYTHFPPSVEEGDSTTLITLVRNAFGGAARYVVGESEGTGLETTSCSAAIDPVTDLNNPTGKCLVYDVDDGNIDLYDYPAGYGGNDASSDTNVGHMDTKAYGAFVVEVSSIDDKNVDVDIEFTDSTGDDLDVEDISIEVAVDATGGSSMMELKAFPPTIKRGANGSVIMKLKDTGTDADPLPYVHDFSKFDVSSEEEDFSFGSGFDGGTTALAFPFFYKVITNGNGVQGIAGLDLNTVADPQCGGDISHLYVTESVTGYNFDSGSCTDDNVDGVGKNATGFYILPYRAPLDIDEDIIDSIEITYEDSEDHDLGGTIDEVDYDLEEVVEFNVLY